MNVGARLERSMVSHVELIEEGCTDCGRAQGKGHDADCNAILGMFGIRVDD